jgi:small subunit ribosomal protein S19
MARSVKKGPYVSEKLFNKAMKAREAGSNQPIKAWSRGCTIVPEFVGMNFDVHNGKIFVRVFVTEEMVGHKFGEFAPTRAFRTHLKK